MWASFILANDQRDARILFYVFIFIYNSLHVSNTQCSSSGETNYVNTTSGNSHSVLVAEMFAGWKKFYLAQNKDRQFSIVKSKMNFSVP
jgi:hypothetical protein